MNNQAEVKIAESSRDLESIFDIRRTVFVEEQKVDEREEYDDFEEMSTHLIARYEATPAGTARFRRTANGIKLERFAVLQEFRGMGLGKLLVEKALELTSHHDNIYLHAQIQVVDFYANFGFIKQGDEFEEAGIRHYKMVYRPDSV